MQVGEAMEVSPEREKSMSEDPLMIELDKRLRAMLDGLKRPRPTG
jgi:hypothetical protein